VPRILHLVSLLTAHLLLAGSLLGAFLCLLLPHTGIQQLYLARVGAGLAGLLLTWVGVLLRQGLRKRRWVEAGVLGLLLVIDGLAIGGGVVLLTTTGALPGPN
jgi:TM2 domain-containing membrane protein YozV